MRLVVNDSFDYSLFDKSSCTFGVFDGLHQGHSYLIQQTLETAGNAKTIALTFDRDPDEIFHPQRLKKLMSNERRLLALEQSGVDLVVVLPFVPELYTLQPLDFLEKTFPQGAPAHLHVGEDFRFGQKASGTVETLQMWAQAHDCYIHPHTLLSADGTPITSTRIRTALLAADLEDAHRLLGHPYTLEGTVVSGRGDGASWGFATANLHIAENMRVLSDGVYAAYTYIDETRYKVAVSVGISPTFESQTDANVEAHILDFEGDLRGRSIDLEFAAHLRPLIKFDSTDELIATVTANIDWIRQNL